MHPAAHALRLLGHGIDPHKFVTHATVFIGCQRRAAEGAREHDAAECGRHPMTPTGWVCLVAIELPPKDSNINSVGFSRRSKDEPCFFLFETLEMRHVTVYLTLLLPLMPMTMTAPSF